MENKISIKVLSTSPEYKILSASGNSGDVLKKHQVNNNALLLVREGNIIYAESTRQQKLSAGDCFHIPAHVIHEVTCTDASKFFVVLPEKSKMRFEK